MISLIEVHIEGFGQYRNKKVSFNEGLNVFTGPNESGKTTLLKFIEGVLFGFYEEDGSLSPDYEKYRPWDGKSYAGTLIYAIGKQRIALYRDLANQSVQMVDADTREDLTASLPVNEKTGKPEPAMRDWKLNTAAFRNTIGIVQGQMSPDMAEIHQQLEEMMLLAAQKDGRISVERSLSSIRRRLSDLDGDGKQSESRIKELARQEDSLRGELKAAPARLRRKQQLEWELSQLPDAVDELEDARLLLEKAGSPEQKEHIEALDQALSEPAASAAPAAEAPLEQNRAKTWRIAAAAAALVSILLGLLIDPWIFCGLAAALVLLFLSGKAEVDGTRQALTFQMKQELSEQEQVHRQARQEDQRRERDQWLCHYATSIVQNRKQLLTSRLLEAEKAVRRDEQMQTQIAEVTAEKDRLLMTQRSLRAAASAMELLTQEVRREYTPVLTKNVAQTVSSMTSGRYQTVYVSEEEGIRTLNPQGQEIPVESVSAGTMDQISFALRLSLIDMLSPQEGLPLILDDAFARYDEGRLSGALDYLARASARRQIIIFSCQNREREMLRNLQISFADHRLGTLPRQS